MKRIVLTSLLALSLAFAVGCKKDAAKPGAAGDKAEKAAKTEKAAQPATAGDKTEKAKAPEKKAEEAAATKPAPNPQDSPAAVVPDKLPAKDVELPISDAKLDEMVKFLDEMTKILETNADDPAKAAAAVDVYLKANKERISVLRKEMQDAQKKMTADQQSAFAARMMEKMGTTMQRMFKLMQDHPDLASDPKLNEVMSQYK